MAASTTTYPTEHDARQAVDTLRARGVPSRHIRLLIGHPPRDLRREPRGGFAGPVRPDAPIGTYAGQTTPGSLATGSFATGSVTGVPDRREGSFADAERIVIVTYKDDAEHSRVTGYRGVWRILRRAAFHDDAIHRAVEQLHSGHAVLLVDSAEGAPGDAWAHAEQAAHAA